MLWLPKLMLFVLLTGASLSGFAQDHRKSENRGSEHRDKARAYSQKSMRYESHQGISLDEAVSQVRRQTRSRVLSAQEKDAEYQIRIITEDGKVRRLRVDPMTGDIH